MGNMSYCRFENTLSDLQDCYQNMDDSLSTSEKQARLDIVQLCAKITEEYGNSCRFEVKEKDYSLSEYNNEMPEEQFAAYCEFEDTCEEAGLASYEFDRAKTVLEVIGYAGAELFEKLAGVAKSPIVKQCLENGVISTRKELESVLSSTSKSAVTKSL